MSKVHPLSTAGLWSKANFSWVDSYMKLARKDQLTQADYPNLPHDDKTETNLKLIKSKQAPERGLFGSVLRGYWGIYFFSIFITTIALALNNIALLLIFYLNQEIESDIREHGRIIDWQTPFAIVMALLLIAFSTLYMTEFTTFYRERIGLRITSGVRALIFDKLLKVSTINPSDHDEGSIINNLQVDSDKFNNTMWAFAGFYSDIINFVVTLTMGIWLFSPIFLVMVGALIACSLIMAVLMYYWFKASDAWLEASDIRLNYWKSIYSAIRYFKARAFENSIHEKVQKRRAVELKWQIINSVLLALYIFLSLSCPAASVVVFLNYYFKAGYQLEVAKMSVFIKVLMDLSNLISNFPFSFQFMNDLAVSVNRINKFLATRELEAPAVLNKSPSSGDQAVVRIQGQFFWDAKPDKTQDEEKAKSKKDQPTSSDPAAASDLSKSLLDSDTSTTETEAKPTESFAMDIDDFSVDRGQVAFVIGKIGSGKSSLLFSLLGEMRIRQPQSAVLTLRGSVGYIGQKPWIVNGTVRDNVVMNHRFDAARFDWAIKYSAMEEDLRTFAQGRDQETGENGDALSGGQRTRLALARALYMDPDIYLFDDILSALDSHVGAFVMQETVLQQLKGKTVVICTHAVQYLRHGDVIYLMDEGRVKLRGSFEEMAGCELYERFLEMEAAAHQKEKQTPKAAVGGDADLEEEEEQSTSGSSALKAQKGLQTGQVEEKPSTDAEEDYLAAELMVPEDKQKGNISWTTIKVFIQAFGGFWAIFIPLVAMMLKQGLETYTYLFLSQWSEKFDEYDQGSQITKYIYLAISYSILSSIRSVCVSAFSYLLSRRVHSKMIYAVIHSRIEEFVSRVPSGRIMNRFSNDLRNIDQEMLYTIGYLYYKVAEVTVSVVFFGYLLGVMTSVSIVVFLIVCIYYQRYYMSAKREFVRLDAISKTPILATFTDTLKGLATIRNIGCRDYFMKKFVDNIDASVKNKLFLFVVNRWYNVRAGLLADSIVLSSSYILLLFYYRNLKMADIAVCLYLGTSLSSVINGLLIQYSQVESLMIAVERCLQFQAVAPETGYSTFNKDFATVDGSTASITKLVRSQASLGGPLSAGKLVFRDVSCRYATSQRPVLDRVSFQINPREKVGVIGRTGSGKSTLLKLLWRSMDVCGGQILLGDVPLDQPDLKRLRSSLMVVTQEPALIEGTLRENIDIRLDDSTRDDEMRGILDRLGFTNQNYLRQGLDMSIESEGANLSAGEKQLVSFARTLMDKKQLIVLDEATANIDLKTEENIQRCMEQEFRDSTMLIIAHRMQTIRHCDKIIVLEKGRLVEFDSPQALANNPNSYYNKVVRKMQQE